MAKATPARQPIRQLPKGAPKAAAVKPKAAAPAAIESTNPRHKEIEQEVAAQAAENAAVVPVAASGTKYKKDKIIFVTVPDILIRPDKFRTESEKEEYEAVAAIAKSINDIGLLQPPTVIANKDGEGYELIAGRRRLKAMDLLQWDEIPVILKNYDEVHQEMAILHENLVRTGYKRSQQDRALSKMGKLYEQLHPETKKGKAGGHAKAAKVASGKGKVTATPRAQTFSQTVAKQTGQSVRKVEKARKRGSVFTDDDFAVLDAREVATHDRDKIAGVTDVAKRAAIIKHIADGAPFEKAWNFEMLPAGAVAEVVPGETADDGRPLGDEEWLAAMPVRTKVVQAAFDVQALFYRRMTDVKMKLERVFNETRKEFKDRVGVGSPKGYAALVNRFIKAVHPKEWKVCGACQGHGKVETDGKKTKCQPCDGGGFVIS